MVLNFFRESILEMEDFADTGGVIILLHVCLSREKCQYYGSFCWGGGSDFGKSVIYSVTDEETKGGTGIWREIR